MEKREATRLMDRREFILSAAAAGLAGFCLQGCITHLKTTPPPVEGETIVFPLAAYPALGQVGGVAVAGPVRIGRYKGNIFVRRVSEGRALVLGARCRHLGCDVEWEPEDNKFVCPCHGSAYKADGELLEGPARRGLYAWEARIGAGRITLAQNEPPLRK